MSLSVKTRFEVLKRDRFICAYCGGKAPDVLLHVDHIVPRAAGGTDDIGNLITSCADCNLGKGARLLEEGTLPAINAVAVAESQQRVEQMREYRRWQEELDNETRKALYLFWQHWTNLFHGTTTKDDKDITHWHVDLGFPEEPSLKRFLRVLPLQDLLDAADATASRYYRQYGDRLYDSHVHRYFFGVCRNKQREREAVAEALREERRQYATRYDFDFSEHGRGGPKSVRKILEDAVLDVA